MEYAFNDFIVINSYRYNYLTPVGTFFNSSILLWGTRSKNKRKKEKQCELFNAKWR